MRPLEIKHTAHGIPFARPYLGTNKVTGKPIRPYKSFPEARDDAHALALAEAWVATLAPAAELHVTQRLGEVLERYVDALELRGLSPNTIKTYRTNARRYVAPYLGSVDVRNVKPYMVDALYSMLLLEGGRAGGISKNKVINVHWFLHGAYRWMCREGLAETNPVTSAAKPSPERSHAVAYDEGEFATLSRAFVEAVTAPAETRDAVFRRNAMMAAYLSLWTGERCGEVCANSRRDAQLARRIMHVGHHAVEAGGGVIRKDGTKNKRTRNVSIGEDVCRRIAAHYDWQRGYLGDQDARRAMVCTDADGKIMRPSKVSQAFRDVRDALGLPKNTSFHTLRHTHATWLILQGVDIKTVSERMGHSSEAITLMVYAHVMPGRDQMAASALAEMAHLAGGAI